MTSSSCGVSNSTVLTFHTNPTASSSSIGLLTFSFHTITGTYYWHLDSISLVDTNLSNLEMLTNGDFESGTHVGWQQLYTQNCSISPGFITNSTCYAGLYCFQDGCKNGYDNLQQTFSVTSEHVYALSSLLRSDGGSVQQVYVGIS